MHIYFTISKSIRYKLYYRRVVIKMYRIQSGNMASSHPSHVKFAAANPVTILHLGQLCHDDNEFRLFLMKSGLLGDFSGQCGHGNVHLVKDKDTSLM